jgi:hypothetical protein
MPHLMPRAPRSAIHATVARVNRTSIHARQTIAFPSLGLASSSQSDRHWYREPPPVGTLEALRVLANACTPSELIWRRDRGGPRADDVLRARAPFAESVHQARRKSADAYAPDSPNQSSREVVVRATDLDPVVADRLAEDVIRRIDRRARIERERRGL